MIIREEDLNNIFSEESRDIIRNLTYQEFNSVDHDIEIID